MSKETAQWLNTMTLIGDTDRRGEAWHYRADLQEGTGNHFAGAIPTERIGELFAPWEPVESPLYLNLNDSEDTPNYVQVDDRKAIVPVGHPEIVHGIFKSSYTTHGYTEWLRDGLSNLVDGEVHFSSAGLLENGAVAWCELSISENQSVAGLEFKPHILAFTSVNGKFATTYKRSIQAVVCDNTLSAAASENGETVKVRHSKYSKMKLASARDALGIIIATADDFSAEVQRMVDQTVTDAQWGSILDNLIPTMGKDGAELSKMALTKAESKRERIGAMYRNDQRCNPWQGTAFGVLQTFNTWSHHEKGLRSSKGEKTLRPERNMLSAIDGTTDAETAEVLNALALVTA